MFDKIRCPSCRGAKKVPKLGGMIGECNTCNGTGAINSCDKPVPVIAEVIESPDTLIKAVADSMPAQIVEAPLVEQDVKVDPKKAIYRRKKA